MMNNSQGASSFFSGLSTLLGRPHPLLHNLSDTTIILLALPGTTVAQEAGDRVRVPTSHANVHMGPSSGRQVLWLAPEGTVLPVIGRQGEWLIVQLSPELRETGIVMRWYRNEDRGYMHESTVEFVEEPRE